MALVVGQNSWSTIAESDTYLEDRIGTSDWFLLEDTDDPGVIAKSTLLTSAYHWLIAAPQVSLTADLTDANVKNAQIEAAIYLQEHYADMDNRRAAISQGVTEFEVSKRQEKFDSSKVSLPQHILGLLTDYSIVGGSIVQLGGQYDA